MRLVITDLDGTLLDHHTYSFEAARPALAELRRRRIPVVLCSSKTRAEMEVWRRRLEAGDAPFIVENGGAICGLPGGESIVLGVPYDDLRRCLREAAEACGATVRGFGDMSVEEVAAACDLPLEFAALARQREYDEPFLLSRGDPEALRKAIERHGLRYTRGGRFHHILGANDKAEAARRVIGCFGSGGEKVDSLGLGDGLNDAGFLRVVRRAVLMPSAQLEALLSLVPGASVAPASGPAGWNEAVLEWLRRSQPPASMPA